MDYDIVPLLVITLVGGLLLCVYWLKFSPPIRPAKPRLTGNLPQNTMARTGAEVRALIDSFPSAKVLEVYDGDTVLVATAHKRLMIRLDSIDCPEDGQPWGDTAKYGLIKLTGGRTIHLEQHGHDDYGRTLATLYVKQARGSGWENVNERMVMLGHAWVMRKYYDHLPSDRQARFNRLEAWAKAKKVGLWGAPNPVPPWQWRNGVNSRAGQTPRSWS
jgi:endonuclease YncB( thermonuclease family)